MTSNKRQFSTINGIEWTGHGHITIKLFNGGYAGDPRAFSSFVDEFYAFMYGKNEAPDPVVPVTDDPPAPVAQPAPVMAPIIAAANTRIESLPAPAPVQESPFVPEVEVTPDGVVSMQFTATLPATLPAPAPEPEPVEDPKPNDSLIRLFQSGLSKVTDVNTAVDYWLDHKKLMEKYPADLHKCRVLIADHLAALLKVTQLDAGKLMLAGVQAKTTPPPTPAEPVQAPAVAATAPGADDKEAKFIAEWNKQPRKITGAAVKIAAGLVAVSNQVKASDVIEFLLALVPKTDGLVPTEIEATCNSDRFKFFAAAAKCRVIEAK